MKFTRPELAHQFRIRLHAQTRKVVEDLDAYCENEDLPGVVVTSISRDPAFYGTPKFSWHLVDCAVDLRNRHYSPEQLVRVEAWLRKRCAGSEWELITHVHGTGPHIHLAYRVPALRAKWEAKRGGR